MKSQAVLIIAGLVFAITGCSSIAVKQTYDPKVDLTGIKSYAWLEKPNQMPANAKDALANNSLLDKQIKKAVNVQLISLGLQMEKEHPDILITYHAGLDDKIDFQTIGGFHRNRFWDEPVYVDEYTEGTLIVDLLDSNSNDIIWRGIAVAKLDETAKPEEVEKTLSKAVEKIFKKLPAHLAS